MPILGGFTRNRKIQLGFQGSNLLSSTVVGTAVAATRVLPMRGVPDVDLTWTHPEVDTGAIYKTVAPFRRRPELTFPMAGQATFNDLPYLFSGILVGGVSPSSSGTSRSWTFQPVGTGSPLGLFTVQFGDDVDGVGEATNDWYQFIGALEEELVLEGPEEMGPFNVRSNWRMAQANSGSWTDYPLSGTVPTAALSVDSAPTYVYLDDVELFIDSTSGAIGTTKISDAVHALTVTIRNAYDLKMFANGSNTRNKIQAYGRGEQEITFEATYAKTTQTVGTGSQSDTVGLNNADSQYVEVRCTAKELASAGIPYSLNIRIPIWNVKRDEVEIGGNTAIRIRGDGFLDSGLAYAIRAVVVNTLSAL
jgi:hypothetical protein